MLEHEPPRRSEEATGRRSGQPRHALPSGGAIGLAPVPVDELCALLARSVSDRASGAGASELAIEVRRGTLAPTLQRLIASTDFTKRTDVTVGVRGKTLEALDGLIAEYHELIRTRALLRRGPKMNRLQQVLTEIREDSNFWLESHSDDTTSRGKKRRVAILALHSEAQAELIEMRAARSGTLTGDVEAFVQQENGFLLKMNGSASSILENVGRAIALAIPAPGDSASAEVSVRIPCDSYGVSFVGFRLLAQASRMDGKTTNIRLEAAVTGGAQIAGLADITGELGFFLQAQGATPEQAMKLISWGWYRQFREARAIPREVANFMWGGSTTSVGWKRSEQWAANIEKEAFKRDYDRDTALSSGVGSKATTNEYVRMGMLTGISADVGGIAGSIVDVSAGASMNAGVHYDQTSVEQAKGGQGKVGVPMKERGRFNLKHLGSAFMSYDTAISASVGPFSGEIGMALELMGRAHRSGDKDQSYPEGYVSIRGSLGLVVPAPKMLLRAIANGIKQLIKPLERATDRIEVKAKQDVKGLVLDGAETQIQNALTSFPTAELAVGLDGSDAWSEVMTGALPMPGSLTLAIAGGYQFGPSSDNFTFDISLSHSVGLSADASLVAFKVSRSSRLFRIVLAPGATRRDREHMRGGGDPRPAKWMIVVD